MKIFPKGNLHVGKIGEVTRVLDNRGRDVMTLPGGPERLVECANALKHVFYPENHVEATDAYVRRLEGLRKDAVARIEALEGSGPSPENGEAA